MKTNQYVKAAQKHLANGHSVEVVVKWWNRMVCRAEISEGTAKFYMDESVSTRQGYRWTGRQYVALEVPVN